jgi:hypothetical protein
MVAVPVRFADAGSAALLRPGDHIDVLTADDVPGAAAGAIPDGLAPPAPADSRAATDVSVLEITASAGDAFNAAGPADGGQLVYLAVDNATAARLARAAAHSRLSYALHSG